MSNYRSTPVSTNRMPGGIPYIIGNEAAERFSFYGMKTILAVFMVQYLHLMGSTAGTGMSEAKATENVHLFNTAVYITPIFGAILCDAFLGKYRTIVYLSVVYCMGHAALAFMGVVGDATVWFVAGLLLIALGSGGIKPCVSAHVGDQFGKSNSHLLPKIYNYFYFSINVGAFLSTLATPWLLKWYGPHWAFGVPGVLMALATILFWMGRNKFVHIPARGTPFILELFSKTGLAAMGKLMIIYLFVAVFWALFDQTGSSWVFQAQDMDRNFLGIEWLESQIQAINPILILTFIPLFTFVVYPALDKVFKLTPLRKVSIGLFLMALGFSMVALVQEWIDAGETPNIGWQVVAYALLTAAEVMVSITCLEFSYTQAPKRMKSIIMALFLGSVALGNFFTAMVNRHIQVPDLFEAGKGSMSVLQSSAEISLADSRLSHWGFDEKKGTEDDIVAIVKKETIDDIEFKGSVILNEAVEKIEVQAASQDLKLPTTEEGTKLIASMKDEWGNPLRYRLMNSKQFRISSDGPDEEYMTRWDLGYVVAKKEKETDDEGKVDRWYGFILPAKPWLDVRKAELGVTDEADKDEDGKDKDFKRTPFAGGQVNLEGADYFWFFTYVMLGTAILFVVVAILYKPKTYLQESEDDPDGNDPDVPDEEIASEIR